MNTFEFPTEKSQATQEHQSVYDSDEDPLKAEVDRILRTQKQMKFTRVLDPKIRTFQKPKSDELPGEAVWKIQFPNGLGHPQRGHFAVTASLLNRAGRPVGGGWVESFENEYDALRCAYILNRMDSSHGAQVVSNEGW